ncbi:MAG: IS3 family transposase [Ktedonobacterales bacterium]
MPKHMLPYPPEFRAEAIRLARTSGKPHAEIARELGMTGETLRQWLKQADVDEGKRSDGLTTDEQEELRRLRRENCILREEREILKKAGGLLRAGDQLNPLAGYEFVEREQANHAVVTLCRVLGVSPSGYWAWRKRPPSPRTRADAELSGQIAAIHQASRSTYGAPRIHAELAIMGMPCGRKHVARLMRQSGLAGCHRRRPFHTTRRDPQAALAPDLVQRAFVASAPNVLWIADITYVPTRWEGFLYLAVILDVFSRRVVGWAMADHLRTELVIGALEMAVWNRRPGAGLVHHSDHGCQYTSLLFGERCQTVGIRCSMGSVGDCYDNAMAESFFATLECELLARQTFQTHVEARTALFEYIEVFYNRQRRHSALDYLSPDAFERRCATQTLVVA